MSGEDPGLRSARGGPGRLDGPESPQPGRRPAAPGELATVQAFINSHFDLVEEWGADRFRTPDGLRDWCAEHRLLAPDADRLTAADADRAIALREGLRALAAGDTDARLERIDALNAVASGLRLRLVFAAGAGPGADLVAADDDPLARALATVLSVTYRAIADGSWGRLKICPGEHCGWAFYDHSRNQSGRWCSMSVCGGRAKARSHYRRARSA